jgi:hypothetical protein
MYIQYGRLYKGAVGLNVHEVDIKENISPPCPSPHIGEKKKEEYVEEKRNKQ